MTVIEHNSNRNLLEPRLALLDDGQIVPYDACSQKEYEPSYNNVVYLGRGTIWSIHGVKQTGTTIYHFWRWM